MEEEEVEGEVGEEEEEEAEEKEEVGGGSGTPLISPGRTMKALGKKSVVKTCNLKSGAIQINAIIHIRSCKFNLYCSSLCLTPTDA